MLCSAASGFAATAESPDPYTFFSIETLATGVRYELDVQNVTVVNQLVGLSSGTSEAHLDTSSSTAEALLPDPGVLVTSAPGLAAGAGGPSLPDYPARATASYPTAPHGAVTLAATQDPLQGNNIRGGNLSADAAMNGSGAMTVLTGFAPTQGPGSASVGSVRTQASSLRRDATHLDGTSTSTSSSIDVLGGILHIGSLTSSVHTSLSNGHATVSAPDIEASGVTLSGVPVSLTQDGLTLSSMNAPLGPSLDSLSAPLVAQGVTVTLTPATSDIADDRASGDSGSLRISQTTTVNGFPETQTITLGDTQASIFVKPAVSPTVVAGPTAAAGSPVRAPSAHPSVAPPGSSAAALPPATAVPVPASAQSSPAAALGNGPPGATRVLRHTTVTARLIDFRPVLTATLLVLFGAPLVSRTARRIPTDARTRKSDLRPLWRW